MENPFWRKIFFLTRLKNMATLNYTQRLQNLQNRKFDRELNESLISKAFSSTEMPSNVKYLVESMRPIEQRSTEKTLDAANRVQKHLEDGFNLNFNRAYRTQGSVKTNTHIKASDFDFLTIIDKYFFNEPGLSNTLPYTSSNPDDDILELRNQATKILKNIYDDVDTSGEKNISVFNKSLNRKVDVVFCFWYHTKKYIETRDEYYKGVYLYKFPTKTKVVDYPFAHLQQVNSKGQQTFDGSRRGIRLLKVLKEDCESKITKLKGFHFTSMVHAISNTRLVYSPGNEITIAKVLSEQLSMMIDNPILRKDIKSPNGLENPFYNDDIIPELEIIKRDLDIIIEDSYKDIINSTSVRRAILNY